jgi:hypothetical protein
MKHETTRYVAESDTCRRFEVDYLRTVDLLQLINTLACKYDSIWVIVDRFTKSAHFIPVHTCYKDKRYAELYIERIICLHGVPNNIISDRGAQFIAHF